VRHTPALVLVSLLLLLYGALCPFQSRESRVGRGIGRPVNLCQKSATPRPEPASIEDQAYESRLKRQAAALMENRRTVAMRDLMGQLKRDVCVLDLPQFELTRCDPVDLIKRARDSVVVVAGVYKCQKCTRWHTTTASGFVISSSGAIVTNYHVVDNDTLETLVVMTSDRRVLPVVEVLAASQPDDLAILSVEVDDLLPLPFAETTAAAPIGAPVGVVSHPDGRFYCYTSGVISRYMRIHSSGHQVDAVSITADYARGSSGAPVLNHQGQVVAVVMSTESVYYTDDGERQRNLQMVFKTCIPSRSLLRLIQPSRLLDTASLDRSG